MRQRKTIKLVLIFSLLPLLYGCGSVAGALGASPLTTQILNAIGWTTTAIDVPRVINNKKTINEEILSELVKKDCRFKRVLKEQKICRDKVRKKYEAEIHNDFGKGAFVDKEETIQWDLPPAK